MLLRMPSRLVGTRRKLLKVLKFICHVLSMFCALERAEALSSVETRSFPNRIAIGSLYDDRSILHTVFRYEVLKHNNNVTTTLPLDKYDNFVNGASNFNVTKTMCHTISSGIFSFFGIITNSSLLRTVESLSRTFNMPFVAASVLPPVDAHNRSTATAFMLYMQPSYHLAIIDVISYYKWTKLYYIYNTLDGLSRLELLTSALNRDEVRVDIEALRIKDAERCHVALRQLDARIQTGDKYIVLDMSSDTLMQAVLKQIQNVGMNRVNYHYLLGGLAMDELDIDDFRHGGANITGFRLVDPNNSKTKKLLSEWSKLDPNDWSGISNKHKVPLTAALTVDAVQVMIKGLRNVWDKNATIFSITRRKQNNNNCVRWTHGETIMQSFLSVRHDGLTGPISFDDRGRRMQYSFDVLSLKMDSEQFKIGTWDSIQGLKMDPLQPGSAVAPPLEANRTRIVTSIISEPYLMEKKKPDDGSVLVGNDRYEGYCMDLATIIAANIGFSFEFRVVKDGLYGEKQPNGTWNGMVGELTRHEADIAIAPLTISSMRERVIDFSKPFMNLGISIMIKKPEKQKPGVFSFMDPLAYQIWMCIVFSYLSVSTVLFLVSRFSPNEWQIEDSVHGPTFTNDFTISNSLWFSLGAFMRRGCDVCPRSLAGRIAGSVWWFFTLIIISSYTANLAAFLTIERMLTPIESADDLAKQTEISYGTLNAGSTKNFFKTSKIQVYEKMWNYMSNDPTVFMTTTEAGVARVRDSKGKYAFLMESTMNDYYNQKKPCNTMKVGDNLDSKGYGIATYINSDLRERINVEVLNLLENEKLRKLQKKWWYDKGECVVESEKKGGSTQSSLSLSNVAGIFYILIAGLGLAMIVASFEFLHKTRLEANRQRKRYMEKTRSPAHCYRPTPERENGGYAYSAPCGAITVNSGFDIGNAHTQV